MAATFRKRFLPCACEHNWRTRQDTTTRAAGSDDRIADLIDWADDSYDDDDVAAEAAA
jgi:hypothetical protein